MDIFSCIDDNNIFFRAHDSLEINSLSRPLHVILLTIPHWIKILLFQDEPIALNYARVVGYFALMSLPLQWVCYYFNHYFDKLLGNSFVFFTKIVFKISVDGIFAPV